MKLLTQVDFVNSVESLVRVRNKECLSQEIRKLNHVLLIRTKYSFDVDLGSDSGWLVVSSLVQARPPV